MPVHTLPDHEQPPSRPDRTAGRPPQVRKASLDDYEQIAALHVRNGLAAKSYDDWVALWLGNPVYQQRGGQWPIGWVLETESCGVVGWVGNIPSAYQFRGHRLCAATPCSWMVDAAHRGYGMLTLNRLLRQRDIDLFVCSNVSPISEPFTRHLRFSRVPIGDWHKSAFWITNYAGFAQIALKLKSVPLARALAYPVSAALICRDRCCGGWEGHRNSIAEIERCWEFDSRFDDFWDELQHQNENVLLAVRTRETLAWHFRTALMQRRAWILASLKGSRLIAYAIFDRQDNPGIGLHRVRLVDFQAHRGSEHALLSALSWMLHKCREDGIHMVEVSGCWLNRPGLPRIVGPYHRTLPSWRYYYKAIDPKLSDLLRDSKIWAPSSFDGDASL